MYYHAKLDYGGNFHYWWDISKEGIIKQLLIPFINGHVVVINHIGCRRILNMKNVTLLTIYKTEDVLPELDGRSIPSEFDDDDFEENECTDEIINEVKTEQSPSSSRSFLQKAFAEPENQVFVIMKFNDKMLDSAYEGVIKPIIQENGCRAIRVDEIQDSGQITDQILDNIASSKFILSELSGERPNCYYETGFAQALGKELILTIRKSEQLHFDLAGYRVIEWETEAELRRKLKSRFESLTES